MELICTSEWFKMLKLHEPLRFEKVQINSKLDEKNCLILDINMKRLHGKTARRSFLKSFFSFEEPFYKVFYITGLDNILLYLSQS